MKGTFLQRVVWWGLLSMLLPVGAAQAQWVRTAPPPPVYERHAPAPGRGYTWVPGYHRWDGRRYVWVGGRWAYPPRPHAAWVPGRWRSGRYGWHWQPGHWRG